MDEPCTNRIRPAGPEASPLCLFQRNKRTSAPFCVQCSSPRTVVAVERGLFILELLAGSSRVSAHLDLIGRAPHSFRFYPVGVDDSRPFVDFRLHIDRKSTRLNSSH